MGVWNEVTIDERVCTGCAVCVEVCPTDVLRLELSTRKAFVAYPEDCQACFLCVIDCAFAGAVTVSVHLSAETRQALERGQHREASRAAAG